LLTSLQITGDQHNFGHIRIPFGTIYSIVFVTENRFLVNVSFCRFRLFSFTFRYVVFTCSKYCLIVTKSPSFAGKRLTESAIFAMIYL